MFCLQVTPNKTTEHVKFMKAKLLEKVGEFEFRLNQGGSDDIQLEALLAQFAATRAK